MADDEKNIAERCYTTIGALADLVSYLGDCRDGLGTINQPNADQVSAEIRDALENLNRLLQGIMREVAGPIWGELSNATREHCRQAGMNEG